MKKKSTLILLLLFLFYQLTLFGFEEKKENPLPAKIQQCIDKAMECRLKDKAAASKY